jgi:hypothetical protein
MLNRNVRVTIRKNDILKLKEIISEKTEDGKNKFDEILINGFSECYGGNLGQILLNNKETLINEFNETLERYDK